MVQELAKSAVVDFGNVVGADENVINYLVNEAEPEEVAAIA